MPYLFDRDFVNLFLFLIDNTNIDIRTSFVNPLFEVSRGEKEPQERLSRLVSDCESYPFPVLAYDHKSRYRKGLWYGLNDSWEGVVHRRCSSCCSPLLFCSSLTFIYKRRSKKCEA